MQECGIRKGHSQLFQTKCGLYGSISQRSKCALMSVERLMIEDLGANLTKRQVPM